MPVPVLVTLKIRYTNRKAPAQRPFLLAGELASPAGRVLVVLPGDRKRSVNFEIVNMSICVNFAPSTAYI